MRKFRLLSMSDEAPFLDGIYRGRRPSQAALKAFNRHCRAHKLNNCRRAFTIEEVITTKEPKQYQYVGERIVLPQEKVVQLKSGGTYTIHYKNVIHKGTF